MEKYTPISLPIRAAPSNNNDGLGDIRLLFPHDELAQNYALSSWEPSIFIRQVAEAHFEGKWRKESFKREGIEALDIANFSDPSTIEEQTLKRARILLQFNQDQSNQSLAAIAYSLLEHEAIWDTFWSMPAFRLWDPIVLVRKAGEKKWKPSNMFENGRVANTTIITWPNGGRQPNTDERINMAKDSMVHYNGVGDLGEVISKKFGTFRDNETGQDQHWQAAHHNIIRVFYDTVEPGAQSKSFDDICHVQVKPSRLVRLTDANGKNVTTVDLFPIDFTLVAVINMSQRRAPGDFLRCYNGIGDYIRVAPDVEQRICPKQDWRLGEMDHRYMLFYARQHNYDPFATRARPREYVHRPNLESDYQMMVDALYEKKEEGDY
ncbi:hypothetical protein NPX13_g8834 [Xylaria arbuscula]|uniref:Uncharacterized protein n=1 Tax=Xylaria arbuscula TaxID=114810 RepID=A0A9W8N7P4_9PEZI|nr:hypothetical protein NPX13_g8834 [Xylaria arbuscula]